MRSEEDFQRWMAGRAQAAHGGAQGEKPRPAATDATLWSFEVVQQAAPKQD